MRYFLTKVAIVACAVCAITTLPAQSAAPMSMGTIGVGAHGYDFLAGAWNCKNGMPSAMSGPSTVTVAIALSPGGGLMFHANGTNYHAMGYVVYNRKTKMWWNPAAGADGSYGTESSVGTGQKNTWTGPYTDAAGVVWDEQLY
jgi:hypothetical protein